MEALGNAWYGSWRPLTNLTETFRACHLCTFNVAAILFRGHPYIWRTTVRHDDVRLFTCSVWCLFCFWSCIHNYIEWVIHTVVHHSGVELIAFLDSSKRREDKQIYWFIHFSPKMVSNQQKIGKLQNVKNNNLPLILEVHTQIFYPVHTITTEVNKAYVTVACRFKNYFIVYFVCVIHVLDIHTAKKHIRTYEQDVAFIPCENGPVKPLLFYCSLTFFFVAEYQVLYTSSIWIPGLTKSNCQQARWNMRHFIVKLPTHHLNHSNMLQRSVTLQCYPALLPKQAN